MDRQIETTDRASGAALTALKNGVEILEAKRRRLVERQREAKRITDPVKRSAALKQVRADEVDLETEVLALRRAIDRAKQ